MYTVVVQFYPWLQINLHLFWSKVMYENEFETRENKIEIKDKLEPKHIYIYIYRERERERESRRKTQHWKSKNCNRPERYLNPRPPDH